MRLNNVSQLAGFAKRDDLSLFTKELCGAEYAHETRLAPSRDMLDAYKKQKGGWQEYERLFLSLMAFRKVEEEVDRAPFETPTVLPCSEHTAEHCHRRLVLEYLQDKWGDVDIIHL